MGFGAVIEYPFDRAFSQRSADDFIHSILKDWLGASEVVTGFDFHFGRGREGGPAFLMDAGHKYGFGVTLIDAFRDENADVVSSSRIRELLKEGDVSEAAGLLGYRYTVEAEVIDGEKLGRQLGFPTANMRLPAGSRTEGRHLRRPLPLRRRHAARCGGELRPPPDSDRQRRPLLETFSSISAAISTARSAPSRSSAFSARSR
jgi:hypothetical protein